MKESEKILNEISEMFGKFRRNDGTLVSFKQNAIEINNNTGKTTNLPYGTYYLKEAKTGEGYNLNENIYEVTISIDNPKPQVDFYNKVIEKKITIVYLKMKQIKSKKLCL